MPIHSESLRRYDLNVGGAQTIIYLSEIALRVVARDAYREADLLVTQYQEDGSVRGILIEEDPELAQRIVNLAGDIATFLLANDTFTPKEKNLIVAAQNVPSPTAA